jgi:hypothetical protein
LAISPEEKPPRTQRDGGGILSNFGIELRLLTISQQLLDQLAGSL